jgi:2-succinyl-6-hydroxy-2,4-cyclohexadiene-1-carboxylate synthase
MTLVLVPGFTQTAESWRGVLDALPDEIDTITLDTVPRRASFEEAAAAIGDHAGEGVYVGYSMGGRLCLRLAFERPSLVRALVLVSASPGLASESERAKRVAGDEELAQQVERDGVAAFLDRWLAQPMFATVPADAPGVADRARLRPAYLSYCLRVLGTGAMEPVWDRLAQLTMPVLLVSGAQDEKFDTIASTMRERIEGADHVRLDGGHALPIEQPAALAGVIATFVTTHG